MYVRMNQMERAEQNDKKDLWCISHSVASELEIRGHLEGIGSLSSQEDVKVGDAK